MKRRPVPANKPPTKIPTSSVFSYASTDIPEQGKFFLIYGEPGEGKTTLAAQFPKPIFIITHGETGIDAAKKKGIADKTIPVVRLPELYRNGEIPPNVGHPGYELCLSTLNDVAGGGHDRRTVVIDTLSGMDKLNEQHCASIEFKGDMSSRGQDDWNAWANGPRRAETYWTSHFIPACLACIEADYNVVLLAHCKSASIKHPNVANYQKYQPDINDRIFNSTFKSVQYLLFLGKQPEFETDKTTKKRILTTNDKFIGLTNETWYTAKNWDNIQDPIFCGSSAKETYANLTEQIEIV